MGTREKVAEALTTPIRFTVETARKATAHQPAPVPLRWEETAQLEDAVMEVVEEEIGRQHAATLQEAADKLDADMEQFFADYPEEPRNSPYALGQKDAARLVREMAERPEGEDT